MIFDIYGEGSDEENNNENLDGCHQFVRKWYKYELKYRVMNIDKECRCCRKLGVIEHVELEGKFN